MRQKSGPEKQPAEDAIRDIRRATRRHFSAEEKIRIVLEGLRGEESIAELCRREGIASSMYYGWSKEFLEAGKRRLAGDTARAATSDEVKDLRREAQALKEVVADLTLDNRLLKKRMARPVCKGFDRERRKISLRQRIRPRRVSPGQDGDTRAPVLATIDRALTLNPACATALYLGAQAHGLAGDVVGAAAFGSRALGLSPFDPLAFEAHMALGEAALAFRRRSRLLRQGDPSQPEF
jgi:transposase